MFFGPEHIPLENGGLSYYPQYIDDPDTLYQLLRDNTPWQQPELEVYGRRHVSPRLVAFIGDVGVSYRYSGYQHIAQPWPDVLSALRDKIVIDTGYEFNCALLNYYRNGNDRMGYHSDDEPVLGRDPCVASLSLGCARDFMLKSKINKRPAQKINLASGSLLLMLPPTQRYWQHALPVRKGLAHGRINITFRKVLLSPQDKPQ